MVFGALKKMASNVLEQFECLASEDELDGVIASCALIAYADNNVSDAEKETCLNAIAGHEGLKSFARDKIKAKFVSDVKLLESDKELATEVLEGKVSAVKDKTARIRMLGIAKQIANADDDFSAAEKQVVDRLRKITG